MDIVSILITLAGIIIMIALYIMGRISQNKLPKKQDNTIPRINDDYGAVTSSVLEDAPATDGSTPLVVEETVGRLSKWCYLSRQMMARCSLATR